MAQVFTASIYGIEGPGGQTQIRSKMGVLNAFSSANVHLYEERTTQGVGNTVCNSVIVVPPQGLNQIPTKYYTPTTVATLVTAANA